MLISNLESSNQAVEKHNERYADLVRFYRAEIAGVEHRLRVTDEDLEQSFRAEIVFFERLRTVKEIKGHTGNSQTTGANSTSLNSSELRI